MASCWEITFQCRNFSQLLIVIFLIELSHIVLLTVLILLCIDTA